MKVLAIIGSYRKGGIVETALDEILASAREDGPETEKIYLIDSHIDFCTNCRTCTQRVRKKARHLGEILTRLQRRKKSSSRKIMI